MHLRFTFRAALMLLGPLAGLAAVPASATTLSDRLAQNAPLICAHRGWLSPADPENDLTTFRHTEAQGPFMLEMDLSVTRDGGIVLMHDRAVDRTTDGHGDVASLSAAQIARLHLRPHEGSATASAPPAFRAVLDWAAATPGTFLMLDIKKTPPALAMPEVRAAKMTSRVLLLTFDPETARRAFASDPDVLVSVLVKDRDDLARYRTMAAGRRFAAYIPATSDAALFQAAHDQGEVAITDLINLKDAFLPGPPDTVLAGKHPDIVVTNHPQATARAFPAKAG